MLRDVTNVYYLPSRENRNVSNRKQHPTRKGFDMKFEFDTKTLKRQVEENPLVAAGVGAALLTGVSKLMTANTDRKRAKTYAKEVNRRIQNQK